ncbi:MAG: HEAT repeat domain-containing protein [bacterium]
MRKFYPTDLSLFVAGIIAFILLLSPASSICLASDRAGTYPIDRALEAIGAQKGDLSIRPDLITNPCAFSRFNLWMQNPENAPLEAQKIARNLLQKAENPLLWIQELSQCGDLSSDGPFSFNKYTGNEIVISGPIGDAVALLLGALHAAHNKMTVTRAAIPAADMKLLEQYAYPDYCAQKDTEEKDMEPFKISTLRKAMDSAGNVKRKEIFEAGCIIINALSQTIELLTAGKNGHNDNIESFSVMTNLGLVEIGGTGPDVHEKGAILIIDLGGNDFYRGEIASGINGKCSVVLDLEGNDTYLGENYTQAFGFWGIGILCDLKGDDLYKAGSCSQGAGLFGIGLLMDRKGSDVYVGERYVQASSAWGLGGLIDYGGEDLYQCQKSGQAYSGVCGVSCLCDLKGNDKYISGMKTPDPREEDMNKSHSQGFAMGMRSMAAGGFALLVDKTGNDLYQCQYFGQGASYWMGVGLLYDETGKDIYIARRYAQGAGIHFSIGALLDISGDDHVYSGGVSQGCGHDYGIGILINEAGNDTYCSDWLSMGASNSNGIGIFLDNSGNDGYDSNAGMGVGNLMTRRHTGGIGLFMDAGGKDRYSHKGSDNSVWLLNRWGVSVDDDSEGNSGINMLPSHVTSDSSEEAKQHQREERTTLQKTMEEAEVMPYPLNIEALISLASHWGFEKEIPEEARQKLLRMAPQKTVPIVVDMLDTPYTAVLGEFFAVHASLSIPELIKKTQSPDPLCKVSAYYYLGMLKDSRALSGCVEALTDSSWRIRSGAIRAIGEILDKGRLQRLIPMKEAFSNALKKREPVLISDYLKDDEKIMEALSVLSRALPIEYETYLFYSKIPSGEDRPNLISKFSELMFNHLDTILFLLERWIGDIAQAEEVGERLMVCLKDPDSAVRKATAYSLGQINYHMAIPQLLACLKDTNLWVRDAAVLSLALFEDDAIHPLSLAMKGETSSFKIHSLDVLSRIKSDQAKKLIKQYLHDCDENVRRAAEQAFAAF